MNEYRRPLTPPISCLVCSPRFRRCPASTSASTATRRLGVAPPAACSALSAVQEFRPEVAVLDIGMPGLNGYKVAEQIRHANRHQSLTLVALSGLGQAEDKRRATEAGFDVHFTKPIDIPALTKLLASIAAQGPSRPVEPED